MIPATILSHLLNIRDISIVSSVRTIDDTVYSVKKSPLIKHNISLTELENKNILVVDDIIGSGLTINKVTSIVSKYKPLSIKILTCYLNLDNWEKIKNYHLNNVLIMNKNLFLICQMNLLL